MTLDRALQRRLLERLESAYPAIVDISTIPEDESAVIRNLVYLEGHGLVANKRLPPQISTKRVHGSTITAHGLDFLADDGGLTATLGVVTVKLHADTVRDLIEKRVAESDLPPEDKKRFIDQVKELPGEALKAATTKLVETGLDHLPNGIATLRTMLGL